MRTRLSRAVPALLLVALSAATLSATSYVVMADPPLADDAELIVTAEVAGSRVSSETGRVMTHYTVFVEDLIKGEIWGSGLEIRVLGGMDEESGHFLKIWGTPQLRTGEKVLLFLGENGDGSYHVTHWLLGAFHELKAGDHSFWVRSIEKEQIAAVAAGARPASVDSERDGELFVTWLRDRAGGLSREIDYYREVPPDTRFVSQFTLLASGDDPVVRWFAFDDGEKVVWKWHKKLHKGIPTKGKRQLKGALAILNKVTARPGAALTVGSAVAKPKINMRYGGKTKSTAGFDRSDNLNVAYGSDIGDWIDAGDFNCSSGGVLAVGGVSFVFNQPRPFRCFAAGSGVANAATECVQAIETAETEFVVNDNTACFYQRKGVFANRIKGAEEVYLHELIHTLGQGHACGDDSSPSCGKSALLNDANMRSTVHGDGDHAMGLGRDDIMGMQFLYSANDPQAPVPSKRLVPGSKKFCKKVKGCGEGQGSCKSNKQCNGGLVCKKKVGAQFGLPAKANVCTAT